VAVYTMMNCDVNAYWVDVVLCVGGVCILLYCSIVPHQEHEVEVEEWYMEYLM
jgi:hypothetical protein